MSPRKTHRRRPPRRSATAPREDAAPTVAPERLQKVLAAAGVASRRECEELIREGRVEVDRQVVTELGTRVDPEQQEIRVDGEALPRQRPVYFAVNKPSGVVSTSRDPEGRPRVIDLLPAGTPRVFCVGRLDRSSEGLILVTNDGELAQGLTHPRHGVEKVYHVQVAGRLEEEHLQQLRRGVRLAEGYAHAKYARIKGRRHRSTIVEMVLDEGRNREIRRLLARVGHKVQRLIRVAVGPVRLGDLPAGAVRPLAPREVEALRRAIAGGRRPGRQQPAKKANGRRGERGGKGGGKSRRSIIGG